LGGKRYVVREGRPTCVSCFHTLLADYCDTCGRIIAVSERHVTLNGRTWHATPNCFRCVCCRQSLLGKPLVRTENPALSSLFCSVECSRDRKHVTSDVTRRTKKSRSSAAKNRRKSLGDLDCAERKANKLRESVSIIRLRETSL